MATTTSVILILTSYLSCALLLSIAASVPSILVRWGSSLAARAPARWLAITWALLSLAVLLPGAWRVAGVTRMAGAPVEIWSGPRADARGAATARVTLRWGIAPVRSEQVGLRAVPQAVGVAAALLAGGAFFSLATLWLQRRRLAQLCAAMPVVKRPRCATACSPAPRSMPATCAP